MSPARLTPVKAIADNSRRIGARAPRSHFPRTPHETFRERDYHARWPIF